MMEYRHIEVREHRFKTPRFSPDRQGDLVGCQDSG